MGRLQTQLTARRHEPRLSRHRQEAKRPPVVVSAGQRGHLHHARHVEQLDLVLARDDGGFLAILNDQEAAIASGTATAADTVEVDVANLPPGTYYVDVGAAQAGVQNNYDLEITAE